MLLIAYGTRPEWLKVKPIIEELKKRGITNFRTLFTGQHKDLVSTSATFNMEVNEPPSGVDRLSYLFGMTIQNASLILNMHPVDITHVMVQGDTTSALAVALAAFHNKIKVIHLESGLRTYDFENPFPEELNRQLISKFADYNLCPTIDNLVNYKSEENHNKVYVVGNTSLDNLVEYKSKCVYENKILITMHRRENHEELETWFGELNRIASKFPDHEFIIPLHPNPNVQKCEYLLPYLTVIKPLEHVDLLRLLVKCKFVISDSGGLQEECSFLGKKVIVCRKTTERPEAIGSTSFMCDDPFDLINQVNALMDRYEVPKTNISPFGDGFAAKKVVDLLLTEKIVEINDQDSEHHH